METQIDGVKTLNSILLASYVNQLGIITLLQIVQDGRVVEVRQIRHILGLFVFRWVHLGQQVLFVIFGLGAAKGKKNGNQRSGGRRTYVDEFEVVTLLQVVQNRGLVKEGQVREVLGLFEFRRVHLGQLFFTNSFQLCESGRECGVDDLWVFIMFCVMNVFS